MPYRYLSITDKVYEENILTLKNDFTQSTNDKYIVIRKVRLINADGQLDMGCCLCGSFADESNYSYGLIQDFIMCSNEMNEKEIHIHTNNLKRIDFWFCDYKGVRITEADNYYYTLELKLIY